MYISKNAVLVREERDYYRTEKGGVIGSGNRGYAVYVDLMRPDTGEFYRQAKIADCWDAVSARQIINKINKEVSND